MKKQKQQKNQNAAEAKGRVAQLQQEMNTRLSDLTYKAALLGTHTGYNMQKFLYNWLDVNADKRTAQLRNGMHSITKVNDIHSIQDIDTFYKNVTLFPNEQWNWRMTNSFAKQLQNFTKDRLLILTAMHALILGNFEDHERTVGTISHVNVAALQAYFVQVIKNAWTLYFEVVLEKHPVLNPKDKGIIGFSYHHTIVFFDLQEDKNCQYTRTSSIVNKYLQRYGNQEFYRVNRYELNKMGYANYKPQSHKQNQRIPLFKMWFNELNNLESSMTPINYDGIKEIVYIPCTFQNYYFNKQEIQSIIFDNELNCWVNKDAKAMAEQQKLHEFQAQMNKELLKRYADFSSAAKLVELLQRIPNFKVKLTEQEQNVVGASGNVLVIGRSGTGKTTCAILRLFAMEMLFKLRLSLYKQKHEKLLLNTQFSEDDIDQNVGLRCVFATASPILTSEVKRYYNKLTEQIKNELEKKKQKQREQKLLQKQQTEKEQTQEVNFEQSQFQIIDGDQQQIQAQEEQFMKEQMEGIQIEKQDEIEADDSDYENEEDKFQQELDKFDNFIQMTDKDFPAFFTIRKLIMMIDGSLRKPFFQRSQDQKVLGTEQQAQWHNENQGVLMLTSAKKKFINNEDADMDDEDYFEESEDSDSDFDIQDEDQLETEYQRQMFLAQQIPQKSRKNEGIGRLAKEVDYNIFLINFWPTVCHQMQWQQNQSKINLSQINGITPSLLWTYIYSYIKGSAQAHQFPGHYLPERTFIQQFQKSSMLPVESLKEIFSLYVKYERWKLQRGYYDLMDVVNYILYQMNQGEIKVQKIHYLMIDEVQDLPHATLYLLSRVTEQGLFFSGDTAQNIAKGVGFRFQDLRSLFQAHNGLGQFDKVNSYQLTTNFRSHNNILQLANSVVSIIELFFPQTIDKLQKERSDLIGPKPIIVEKNEGLFLILRGDDHQNEQQIEFGCNQVIIVKDQDSKKKVPQILQHALILTIYEAKGLEFDDVILYNFFCDESIDNQWNLINCMDITDQFVDKDEFNLTITRHSKQQDHDAHALDNIYGFQEVNGKFIIKKFALNQRYRQIDIQQFSSLCNELKQLYVAITRPKKRLIIYDDVPEKRQNIQQLWQALNLVDIYSEDLPYDQIQNVVKLTDVGEWKKQGIRMFRNKFYEQAVKCFTLAKEDLWVLKSKAHQLAEEATALMAEIEQRHLTQPQNKQFKTITKEKIQQKKKLFHEASELFFELKKPKQAAQCLYSAENYQAALKIYEDEGLIKEAGEAAFQCQLYSKAGQYFLQSHDMIRAIDSFERAEDWDGIFKTIQQLKDQIDYKTRQTYLNRYIPMIFNKLANEVGQNEEKQQQKEQNNNIIEEDQEDDESDEDDDDVKQPQPKKPEQTEQKEQKEQQEGKLDQSQIEKIQGQSFQIQSSFVDQTLQLGEIPQLNKQESDMQVLLSDDDNLQNQSKPELSKQESDNVVVIDDKQDKSVSFIVDVSKKSDSFQVDIKQVEESQELNFDHLSNYDLDDQWLKGDSKSIIESIQSKKSDHSDFSAISFAQIQNNPNMQLVKTKGDIFIQDSVMQNIIRYISMFSDDFKQQLIQQRSQSAQLSNKAAEEIDYMVDFILDLDLVDINFIYLVLDILEQFKSHKLCIFVCNRYKLADKLGRFLTSIAASYSPLSITPANFDPQVLVSGHHRTKQTDKGLVASFAVHSVFENINPEFLRIKYENETLTNMNSLGLQCYQQLLMLGYWKKIVYQLDIKNALIVCEVFQDYKNWKYLFFTAKINQLQEKINKEEDLSIKSIIQGQLLICQKKQEACFNTFPTDLFYFDQPKDQSEIQYSINTLEQFYNDMINQLSINDNIFRAIFIRTGTLDPKLINLNIKKVKLPQFLKNTQILFESIIRDEEIPEDVIIDICDTIQNKDTKGINYLKLYESALFILVLEKFVYNYPNYKLSQQLSLQYSNNIAIKMRDTLHIVIRSCKYTYSSLQDYNQLLIRASLFLFRCRLPSGPVFQNYQDVVFVHRSSILIYGLLERRQKTQLKRGDQIILDNMYFADIDYEFIIAPINLLLDVANRRLTNEVGNLFTRRLDYLTNFYTNKLILQDSQTIEASEQSLLISTIATCLASRIYEIHHQQIYQPQEKQKRDILESYEAMEKKKLQKKYEEQLLDHLDEELREELQQNEQNEGLLLIRDSNSKTKMNLLKELLRQIMRSPYTEEVEPTVKVKLIELGLNYFSKVNEYSSPKRYHNYIIKGILLFNYLGLNNFSLLFIQKNRILQQNPEAYNKYIEYLVCKKYNIISDAAECYFQYHAEKFNSLYVDEIANNLANILVLQLISYLHEQGRIIKLPFIFLSYLQNIQEVVKNGKTVSYLWKAPIHPTNEDQIYETLEWIVRLMARNQALRGHQILLLLTVYALNMEVIPLKQINLLKDIKFQIVSIQFQEVLKSLDLQQKQRWNQLCIGNIIQLDYALDVELFEVRVENTLKSQEDYENHYSECLFEWENIARRNKLLEFKVNKIKKYWKIMKLNNNLRNDADNKPHIFKKLSQNQMQNRLISQSLWSNVIDQFKLARNLLITTMYSMYIDNPVDFHFICQQLEDVNKQEEQYSIKLMDYVNQVIDRQTMLEIYSNTLQEIQDFKLQLEEWQKNNVKFEININKLLERNRRMLAVKWANQKAGIKLQQIQKRKKGLKKQQLLQEKKMMLKGI